MPTDRQRATVRITDEEGKVHHGVGFLAAPGLIVTCAHVVVEAVNGTREAKGNAEPVSLGDRDPPADQVQVSFLLLDDDAPRPARVAGGGWFPDPQPDVRGTRKGRRDIAVLELMQEAPPDAQPGWLADDPDLITRPFDVFGPVPSGDLDWPGGEIRAGHPGGWVILHVDSDLLSGDRPGYGFSGGAVWTGESRNRIAGILVHGRRDGVRGRMIPAEILRDLWRPEWPRLRGAPAWTSARRQGAAAPRAAELHVHLADRETVAFQLEEHLERALSERPNRPQVLVVSGTGEQRLPGFLGRVTGKLIPDLIQELLSGSPPLQSIPDSGARPLNLDALIRSAVKARRNELGPSRADEAHLSRRLDGLHAPVLLSNLFYASQDPRGTLSLVEDWIDYWTDAPDTPEYPVLVLVGLEVPAPFGLRAFLAFVWNRLSRLIGRRGPVPERQHPLVRHLAARCSGLRDVCVPPQIGGLHRDDVRRWASAVEYEFFPGLDRRELEARATRPFASDPARPLPMAALEQAMLDALRSAIQSAP